MPAAMEQVAKNNAIFKEYVRQLKAGDLIQAQANLATLKSHLKGENLDDPFWNERIPAEFRKILQVGALCSSCLDGSCAYCKGKGDCPACLGKGLCKSCEGRGGTPRVCTKCVCPTCSGTRLCTACKGRRFVTCSTCNGSGTGREERKFEPCRSCRGLGWKEGLKAAGGVVTKLRCLLCGGTKGVYNTVRFPCAVCDGEGRRNCANCQGLGVCPSCKGLGRRGDCLICKGRGRFLEPCIDCKGTRQCVECAGTKLCKRCKGRHTCSACAARNLLIRYNIPIDQRWLVQPEAKLIRLETEELSYETPAGAPLTFQFRGRTLSAELEEGRLLWVSAPENFRRIRDLFTPEP
ncbi:MAG: hypothetical protein R6X19_09680 [Kiritimatiellia bacterium]